MSSGDNRLNPFLFPGDLQQTICEVSQGLSLIRCAVTREDPDPVELSFDESMALDALLRGLRGALTHALGEIMDAKDAGRLKEVVK